MTKKRKRHNDSKGQTRILIVDDHSIVRKGLIQLVNGEPDLVVCAEAEDAGQALGTLEKQQIDLAIVDISLEGTNGLELTERMKLRCPGMIVLILSMYDGLLYAQRALRAGASGYIVKSEAADKIIAAIRQVLNGQIYVSDSKAVRMMPDAAFNETDSFNCDMTIFHNPD